MLCINDIRAVCNMNEGQEICTYESCQMYVATFSLLPPYSVDIQKQHFTYLLNLHALHSPYMLGKMSATSNMASSSTKQHQPKPCPSSSNIFRDVQVREWLHGKLQPCDFGSTGNNFIRKLNELRDSRRYRQTEYDEIRTIENQLIEIDKIGNEARAPRDTKKLRDRLGDLK